MHGTLEIISFSDNAWMGQTDRKLPRATSLARGTPNKVVSVDVRYFTSFMETALFAVDSSVRSTCLLIVTHRVHAVEIASEACASTPSRQRVKLLFTLAALRHTRLRAHRINPPHRVDE